MTMSVLAAVIGGSPEEAAFKILQIELFQKGFGAALFLYYYPIMLTVQDIDSGEVRLLPWNQKNIKIA